MAADGWEFWQLTRAADGTLAWLAATRPDARSVIDRQKVWTLIPLRLVFIANWIVTEDHWREAEGALWLHEPLDVVEAREVAIGVPQPTADDLARISRPEGRLTLDQIDRFPVEKLLGKRVAAALAARR